MAGASQTDLGQHIASSAPAALRVGDAMRLLPLVLRRHDARVRCAYNEWLARTIRYEDAGQFTEAACLAALFEDPVQLNALVRELQLQRYQRWLPAMLRWEFYRTLEGAARVEVTVPDGLAWATPGKRPKQRPGRYGGFRLEDLERTITLFVRCVVTGESKKQIAKACGITPRDVRHHVRRARTLLDCIA